LGGKLSGESQEQESKCGSERAAGEGWHW
jgi:hypothetical protein